MSLRQLKFKPKLQLNTAPKNKTDDNSRPSIKVACNTKNNVSSDCNPTVVEAENKTNEDLTGLRDSATVSVNDSEASTVCKSVPKTADTSEDISTGSVSINHSNTVPIAPKADIHENGPIPSIGSSDVLVDNLRVSNTTVPASQPLQTLVEESEIPSGSDSEDNVDSSILSDSNRKGKSLINYDILNKISSLGSQQVSLQNHDRQNIVDKDFQEVLPNDGNKTALNDSIEKNIDNKRSEKSRSLECVVDDTCPVKVSKIVNKENLQSSRNNKLPISSKSNYGSKTTKRKKFEGKNIETSPSKVSTHQRPNFKPNVAALGKIRRPEKFTTSSYSKMGSLAKEQFLKKFGKQQEPDASKLTMMDLIFYNPSTNPMPQSSDKKLLNSLNSSPNTEKVEEKNSDVLPENEINENNCEETNENIDDVLPVPQLKISADGKVIVAQESLVIKTSNNLDSCNFETVIDSELKKRKPVKNPNRCGWSHVDTIKFYKALNSLGCDFETMQSIFPDRSRKNLKSKFKKEEKLHGSLINKVLSRHSEFDLTNVVRELEIDSVYKDTIKTYGRGFAETEKRSKGRKKSLSMVVAGKSSKKKDGDESDDSISDEEFGKKKKKVDLEILSRMSEVLGLNDENNSSALEGNNKLSNSESSDVSNIKESETTKRKRKKLREYVESDSDFERDLETPITKNVNEEKNTSSQSLRKNQRIMLKRKKVKPPAERIKDKRIVLRLDELIDFNDGSINEPEPKSQTEIINDNHIVINTNIEFENVKYTRYISYNSNNLENPIEINETVAHVD
ncbi:transcription factor TFIIIB component B'' homolog [Halyomorpha halys]|uniref:transcription factor TFIIIB component B'' homolog n=1 Tax=Halyomorpha halys TaxID=286706 RepID=UPI0006D4F639|nr:transcription factor TFIIIB component B'' homolog [Halyomorpha halys]